MNHLLSHPATVHVPLALGVLLPFAYPLILWALRTKRLPVGFLWVFTGLAAMVLASGTFAYLSGESAKPLSAADADLIAHHESLAKWFCSVWTVVLVLSTLSTLNARFRHWTVNVILILLLLGQLLITVQLGRLGGQIVFGFFHREPAIFSWTWSQTGTRNWEFDDHVAQLDRASVS